MNKHILKLIWNRRKSFVWIFIEQVLVFVILSYCFMQVATMTEQYFAPENPNVDNTVFTYISTRDAEENFGERYSAFKYKIENSKYVEYKHYGIGTYSYLWQGTSYNIDSLLLGNRKYPFYVKKSDANFQKIFRTKMLEGVWYKDEVMDDGSYPVVLTKSLVDSLKLDRALGTKLNYTGKDFTVTGVIHDFKQSTYEKKMPAAIFAYSAFDNHYQNTTNAILRIKEGQMNDFIGYYYKEAQKEFPGQEGYSYTVMRLDEMAALQNTEVFLQLAIILIPAIFLTVFAFLGTFSLIYRQSKKLTGEYGLRMALGSTKGNLRSMVMKQSIIISVSAALVGCIINLNLYIFIFSEIGLFTIMLAGLSTFILIMLFSIVSVWYPAQKATKIQPAIALKQEE